MTLAHPASGDWAASLRIGLTAPLRGPRTLLGVLALVLLVPPLVWGVLSLVLGVLPLVLLLIGGVLARPGLELRVLRLILEVLRFALTLIVVAGRFFYGLFELFYPLPEGAGNFRQSRGSEN